MEEALEVESNDCWDNRKVQVGNNDEQVHINKQEIDMFDPWKLTEELCKLFET